MLYPLSYGSEKSSHLRATLAQQSYRPTAPLTSNRRRRSRCRL